jgi:hypothetical protein
MCVNQIERIRVHLVQLPFDKPKGLTLYDGVDHYDIFINAKISGEELCHVYDHEMSHIDNHDFDSMYSADYLEKLRHE